MAITTHWVDPLRVGFYQDGVEEAGTHAHCLIDANITFPDPDSLSLANAGLESNFISRAQNSAYDEPHWGSAQNGEVITFSWTYTDSFDAQVPGQFFLLVGGTRYNVADPSISSTTNPATSANWTIGDLFAVEFGIENTSGSTQDVAMLKVFIDAGVSPNSDDAVATSVSNPGGADTTFYAAGAGVVVLDSRLVVAAGPNIVSAEVAFTANYSPGVDVLAFVDQLGIAGTWTPASGILALAGTASAANYQTALRSITYEHTGGGMLDTEIRSLTVTIVDALSASSTKPLFLSPPIAGGLSIDPAEGDYEGGTAVSISGSGFAAGASVLFDVFPATSVVVVSPGLITCVTPAHEPGLADVFVANPHQTRPGVIPDGFLFFWLTSQFRVRRDTDVRVRNVSNDTPDTCSFSVDGADPLPGTPFIFSRAAHRLFKGTIQSREQVYEEQITQLAWNVVGVSNIWLLNRRRPVASYVQESASDIVVDLVARFAEGFTTAHVQTGLEAKTIDFNGTEDFAACLTRLAKLINGQWYLDYFDDLHFFFAAPPALPLAAVRAGPSAALTVADSVTDFDWSFGFSTAYYTFFYAFEFADGVISDYSPMAIVKASGSKQLTFGSILTGSPVAGQAVVARRVYYRSWTDIQVPSSQYLPRQWFRVNDNTTTSLTWDGQNLLPYPGADDPVIARDSVAHGFAGTPGRLQRPRTPVPAGPSSALTAALGAAIPGAIWDDAYALPTIRWEMTFVYADGRESDAGTSLSNTLSYDWKHYVDFSGLAIGPTLTDGTPCLFRIIYLYWSTVDILGVAHVGAAGWLLVPNNTDTTYNDYSPPGNPLANGYVQWVGAPPAAEHVNGPSLEESDLPEDIDNLTNQTLLRDAPISSSIDHSQIRNRVFVVGAGSSLVEARSAGAVSLHVSSAQMFEPSGGLVVINNAVVPYVYVTGETMVLPVGIPATLPAGTAVNLWAQTDDVEAQQALAAIEGGDGVHEFTIVDSNLVSAAMCDARGKVELSLFAKPSVSVSYACRDWNTRAGKTVVFDMSAPPLAGALKIQEVAIDQILASPLIAPRFSAKASSVRYSLDDLLRALVYGPQAISGSTSFGGTGFSGGGGGGGVVGSVASRALTADRLTTPRLINGVAFDGSGNITLPLGGGGEPLTNGNGAAPELIFDSFGDVIMVEE